MKKNKLNLSKLKVRSFVTSLEENSIMLKGGSQHGNSLEETEGAIPATAIPNQCNNSVVDDSTSNETITQYGRMGCDGFTMIDDLCQTYSQL